MGDVRHVRPGRCRIVPRCASRCPASKPRSPTAPCRLVMSTRSPTPLKGSDDAGRERFGGLQDDLLGFARVEPVAVFERRCRLLGKRFAGDEGESELDKQKAAVSVRRWVDKPSGMHHTHLALDPERDAKLWSAIDAQLATIKQADGNAGTPIDLLLADAVVAAVSGERSGSGGCRRSVSTSTTTRCSTGCTNTRCVRPPTGSRCHPRRCDVWRVRRRSCRSRSTAPVRCWTAAATTGSRTGRSGGRCGRCTAPAATPAATSCSIVATSTTSSNGSERIDRSGQSAPTVQSTPPPRA